MALFGSPVLIDTFGAFYDTLCLAAEYSTPSVESRFCTVCSVRENCEMEIGGEHDRDDRSRKG